MMRHLEALLAARSVQVLHGEEAGSDATFVVRELERSGFAGRILPGDQDCGDQDCGDQSCSDQVCGDRGSDEGCGANGGEDCGEDCGEGSGEDGGKGSGEERADLAIVYARAGEMAALIDRHRARIARMALLLETRGQDRAPLADATRADILRAARAADLRVIGPGATALIVPRVNLALGVASASVAAGTLAFVSQSGGIASYVTEWAERRGLGFSAVLALGSESDVVVADLLDLLAADGRTRAVIVYLEKIANIRRFLSAARALARVKPVLVLRGGRTLRLHDRAADARARESDALDVAFRRAGLLQMRTLSELVAASGTLATGIDVRGPRVVVVSNGRGAGLVTADLVAERGLALAELEPSGQSELAREFGAGRSFLNPLLLGDDADPDTYSRAIDLVSAMKSCDVIVVVNTPAAGRDATDLAQVLLARRRRPPLIAVWLGEGDAREASELASKQRLPSYETPEDAVAAIGYLLAFRRGQIELMETPPSSPNLFERDLSAAREVVTRALDDGRASIDGVGARALLRCYGIEVTHEDIEGVPFELECVIDPVVGPVLRLHGIGPWRGASGTALPPLTRLLAGHLIDDAGADAGLEGGGREELEILLVKVGQIIAEHRAIVGLRMWIVVGGVRGGTVQAASFELRRAQGEPRARLAISPYPSELEEDAALRDGTPVRLRPIRAEDEPALQRFFARLSNQDVEMRFFSYVRELGHPMAARMSQLDYDREMALLALPVDGEDDIMAVVRLITGADDERSEFAVTVRSDLKGRGLGWLMMTRIIAYGRKRGTSVIWGSILTRNRAMLQLARELGFATRRSADDPAVSIAELPLA